MLSAWYSSWRCCVSLLNPIWDAVARPREQPRNFWVCILMYNYPFATTRAFAKKLRYHVINKYCELRTRSYTITLTPWADNVEMYWLLEAYILKYRYIRALIYTVFGVCLVCLVRMHAHSADISSWVWNDHHLKEIMHQPNWSHTSGR
jgi:hypothetical protein